MQFLDQVDISLQAGKGGDGCLSFRRERNLAKGGPDGGDGGDGGSIYLLADKSLNTLIDYNHKRTFKARSGQPGSGSQKTGAHGEDLYLKVPVGVRVLDAQDSSQIGELIKPSETLLIAQGGRRGLGNMRFKSSTNRAPRQYSKGTQGEQIDIRLELQLLADIGLLGLPNAGKSSFINQVSSVRTKIADYPFTTLIPKLGVVKVETSSFVIADIPGLIRGASQGIGLGTNFLRHLVRNRLLLHLVDCAPIDGSDPTENLSIIDAELLAASADLAKKPRWLVLNKIDLIDVAQVEKLKSTFADRYDQIFAISAMTGEGCTRLCQSIYKWLSNEKASEAEDIEYAEHNRQQQILIMEQLQNTLCQNHGTLE